MVDPDGRGECSCHEDCSWDSWQPCCFDLQCHCEEEAYYGRAYFGWATCEEGGPHCTCFSCDSGHELLEDDGSCAACSPGKFSAGGGHACTPCNRGSFASDNASAACTVCPGLQTTMEYGSTALSDCLCPAGYYEDETGACERCPAGTYKPPGIDSGLAACKPGLTTNVPAGVHFWIPGVGPHPMEEIAQGLAPDAYGQTPSSADAAKSGAGVTSTAGTIHAPAETALTSVILTDVPNVLPEGSSPWTMTVWIRNPWADPNEPSEFFTGQYMQWTVEHNRMAFRQWDPPTRSYRWVRMTTGPADPNQWHHFAIVMTQDGLEYGTGLRYYMDGNEGAFEWGYGIAPSTLLPKATTVQPGALFEKIGGGCGRDGCLEWADLRVYSRALSEQEIRNMSAPVLAGNYALYYEKGAVRHLEDCPRGSYSRCDPRPSRPAPTPSVQWRVELKAV